MRQSEVTVFGGITDTGGTGQYHSSKLIDMPLDWPVVIEFFDTPDKSHTIIEHLSALIKPGHLVH